MKMINQKIKYQIISLNKAIKTLRESYHRFIKQAAQARKKENL
jgi:hypothetical protein